MKELDKIKQINKEQSIIEYSGLQKFIQNVLNKSPNVEDIQKNTLANGALYLPISYIETALDEIFFGLWQTENFKYQIVVNEIIGSIDLVVYHPRLKQWIRRTGAASTPIQLKKGSGVTQVDQKIYNTLVKDFPHLKAECIKNAAKSFGKIFGRDLNRNFEDNYVPLLKLPENEPATEGQIQLIDSLLHTSLLDENSKQQIEREMHDYLFNDASICINYLQLNQQKSLDKQLDDKLK